MNEDTDHQLDSNPPGNPVQVLKGLFRLIASRIVSKIKNSGSDGPDDHRNEECKSQKNSPANDHR